MEKKTVNIVIIGVGDITRRRHIPGILKAQSGRLYGFCNRTPEKAKEAAEEYGARFYETVEEVLQDASVDAVLIATPPDTHAALAVAALRAGKHVLLEKPMALSMEDAEAIEKEAGIQKEKGGAKLMMLHIQRFYEPHKKAKELLEKGEIGRLLSCRTFLGNSEYRTPQMPRKPYWQNALFNVGIHRIDLLQYLTGAKVTGVFGYRSHLLFPEEAKIADAPDDHAIGILQYDNDVVATLIASKTSFHGEDRSTILIGTEGTITTYTREHSVVLEKRNGDKQYFDFPTGEQAVLELTDIHEEFCCCILENREMSITAWDGTESMKIVKALEEADQKKMWVTI